MDNMKVINLVIILFFMMMIGLYGKRKGYINKDISRGLSEIILNITLPLMIISSFNYTFSKDMLNTAYRGLLYSFAIHICLIFLSKLFYYKYPQNSKSVLRFITIFSNCGYMGYPVLESLYGKIGVFYGAIFNIPFNVFLWTVGVMLFTESKDFNSFKKTILNPGLIAVILGIIIFIFSIEVPYPIYKTMENVGSITTPLSMMVVGAMLGDIKFKDIFSHGEVYYGIFIRLIVVPMATFFVLRFFGVEKLLIDISVIIMAMPAAVNTAVFAEKYGGNASLASKIIFLSTILSIITIPLVILFIY